MNLSAGGWQFRSSARKVVFPLWSWTSPCSSVTCSYSFSFCFSEWYLLTTLRQRPLQKQAGPLAGFSDVEQNTGLFQASWAELSYMHEAKRFYPSEKDQDDYFHVFIFFFFVSYVYACTCVFYFPCCLNIYFSPPCLSGCGDPRWTRYHSIGDLSLAARGISMHHLLHLQILPEQKEKT